ncbi:M56 family metallopeptidase [Colwellia echini]|uniref:Protein TonB n=1 Tax=Colwellia echini TaxID=1982103 RepID=A0ABY3MXV9_9GAMM|nr:M56 family metallopeptidase [Colwellia echini]TYK66060.1 TonB family protein [Colwellia echini]
MFELILNSPFLYSLSLTLVHFLWQGLLVGLILKSALLIIDKNKSKLRYNMATFAMLSNILLAIFTFVMVFPESSANGNGLLNPIPLTYLVNELAQHNVDFIQQDLLSSILAYGLPYLAILWLLSIGILASKLLIEVRNVNSLPLRGNILPSNALLSRFEQLAKQLNLIKTPQLLISLKIEVPMAIGWLKPVVLLPASMVTGLNSAQLEMLILHELAHIRRHDYLVNFLQTLIELLFFFHPSVHWIGKQMRNEREYCSDDIAVQHCGDAIAYAHTLTDTASLCSKKHCHTIPTMAMAASGGDLKARVLRLVDHHCAPSNTTSKWFAAISLLLGLTLLGLNQILTMPIAQNLGNAFSWQESHPIVNEKHYSALNLSKRGYLGSEDDFITLSNNSIAVHLLRSNDEKKPKSLVESITLTTTPKQKLVNNIVVPTPLAPQLRIKSTPKLAQPIIGIAPKKSTISEALIANAKEEDNYIKATIDAGVNEQKIAAVNSKPTLSKTPNPTLAPGKIAPTKIADNKIVSEINNNIVASKNTPMVSATQLRPQPSNSINDISAKHNRHDSSQTLKASNNTNIVKNNHKLTEQVKLTDAKLLDSISPVYPTLAQRRGIELEVKVNFTIDRNGEVKDINFEPQSKITYFKSAVRSAMQKWRFSPAKRNDDIVESKMSKIFSFNLQS